MKKIQLSISVLEAAEILKKVFVRCLHLQYGQLVFWIFMEMLPLGIMKQALLLGKGQLDGRLRREK